MPKSLEEVIVQSLKESEKPHLYLLNIGLNQDEYNLIAKMNANEREEMAIKIIRKCSESEFLSIIYYLTENEFSSKDPMNPSGCTLLVELVRGYVKEKGVHFPALYGSYLRWYEYGITEEAKPVINLWDAIQRGVPEQYSEQSKNLNLRILPYRYYKQLLSTPPPNEESEQIKKFKTIFEKKIINNTNLPKPAHIVGLAQRLQEIKEKILKNPWDVGRGGVDYGEHQVPHRIKDILNLIDKAQRGDLSEKEAYRQIIGKASEGIYKLRWWGVGRQESTTEKYREIFQHTYILDEQSSPGRQLTK